ncbi:MAG: hypothetical protein OEU32_03750 [Acidimicrobiia bacterium]|nr:hypothetical protein [Acidimicrobiia bacterium]
MQEGLAFRRFDGLDALAAKRAALLLIAAVLVIFVGWRASMTGDDPEPTAVDTAAELPPGVDLEPVSSWPAGPLQGVEPTLASGQALTADGCVDAGAGEPVLLDHTGAASIWLFGSGDDVVSIAWSDGVGTSVFEVPADHFTNEFTTGRVTVSLNEPSGATTISVTSSLSSVRVCGIDGAVD